MTSIRIPLLVPELPDAEAILPYLRRIDASRWYSNFGPLVCEFEESIAQSFRSTNGASLHLTSVSNATLGLELAITALGLPPGSKVLVPALTFVATATAVIRAGHVPVAGDIDPETWLLEPALAERCITALGIAAVIPVATFGLPVDTRAWDSFADNTGLPVVIDAAAAFGNLQEIGRALTVFSLHATKPLSSGEGGVIVSTDQNQIKKIRRLSNFGINLESGGVVAIGSVSEAGTNAKMSEYHAAVGLAALVQWPENLRRRLELARVYTDGIRARNLNEHACLQARSEGCVRSTLCIAFATKDLCDKVVRGFDAAGIAFRKWYRPLIPDHAAFHPCNRQADIHNARDLSERILGVPFFPGLTGIEVEEVCKVMAESAGL